MFHMHSDGYNVSADIASIRSSGALPDSTTHYNHDNPPESPTIMAQPGLSAYPPPPHPPAIPERDPGHDDVNRPSEDSPAIKAVPQLGSSRPRTNTQSGRDRKGSIPPPAMETSQFPTADPDMSLDDPPPGPPPNRTPSRQQIMRWGVPPPPASDYGYDDMGDRRYHPRPPYDYGMPVRPQPQWYGEEASYYNRPYQRRMSAVRESTEFGGGEGPPRPPRRPRFRGHYDDGSDGDDSDERPLRKPRKKRSNYSDRSSPPPPDVVLRLPFTDWMNTTLKGRMFFISRSF